MWNGIIKSYKTKIRLNQPTVSVQQFRDIAERLPTFLTAARFQILGKFGPYVLSSNRWP